MHIEKIKNKGQATLFNSNRLEALTKTRPVVIYSMYLPVIGFMLYYGVAYHQLGAGYEALLFIAGTLSWSLFEYIMHRWLFHMLAKARVPQSLYTPCTECTTNSRAIKSGYSCLRCPAFW